MTFQLQYKSNSKSPWTNHPDFPASTNRATLATACASMAKANVGTVCRVLTTRTN